MGRRRGRGRSGYNGKKGMRRRKSRMRVRRKGGWEGGEEGGGERGWRRRGRVDAMGW